jgi:hypothetical protein
VLEVSIGYATLEPKEYVVIVKYIVVAVAGFVNPFTYISNCYEAYK